MTHYYVGDTPADPVTIEPALDLTSYDTATAVLVRPDGTLSTACAAVIAAPVVQVELPAAGAFPLAGLYSLRVTVAAAGGQQQRLAPVFIVVDSDQEWTQLDVARDPDQGGWREAQTIGDVKLWRLLQIARIQCESFGRPLTDPAHPPVNYVEAQLQQAQNIWNAGRVSPAGDTGGEDFAFRPVPLDWHVKNLLRPAKGLGAIA